jgi:hypothetical protein
MENKFFDIKLDKNQFSVVSLTDKSDEKEYWLTTSPIKRLQHIEVLRRINYGNSATSRLQRVLEIASCNSGELKS